MHNKVAVLFAAPRSIYKTIPRADVYDKRRDARTFPGGQPVIAHPPCAQWSSLRHQAHHNEYERQHALWALDTVRQNGGILEHPERSIIWGTHAPRLGQRDHWGYTIVIDQFWWGHKARKRTGLYIVGVPPHDLPTLPYQLGDAPYVVTTTRAKTRRRPELPSAQRSATPPLFATWLIQTACRASIQ